MKASDFNFPLADFGETLTRTPAVKTTDFYGDEIITFDSPETITGIFFEIPRNSDIWMKYGLAKSADGVLYVGPDTTLSKYDKITVNNKVYQCDVITNRGPSGEAYYRVTPVYYVDVAITGDVFPMTFPFVLS